MHELGIVYEVIKVVDAFVKENQLVKVEKIVLEIGQLSQAIPRFITSCFPAAVSETPYEDTTLEIQIIQAIGLCKSCDNIYHVIDHRKVCPKCQHESFELLSGQEFEIKEIVAC